MPVQHKSLSLSLCVCVLQNNKQEGLAGAKLCINLSGFTGRKEGRKEGRKIGKKRIHNLTY